MRGHSTKRIIDPLERTVPIKKPLRARNNYDDFFLWEKWEIKHVSVFNCLHQWRPKTWNSLWTNKEMGDGNFYEVTWNYYDVFSLTSKREEILQQTLKFYIKSCYVNEWNFIPRKNNKLKIVSSPMHVRLEGRNVKKLWIRLWLPSQRHMFRHKVKHESFPVSVL